MCPILVLVYLMKTLLVFQLYWKSSQGSAVLIPCNHGKLKTPRKSDNPLETSLSKLNEMQKMYYHERSKLFLLKALIS